MQEAKQEPRQTDGRNLPYDNRLIYPRACKIARSSPRASRWVGRLLL